MGRQEHRFTLIGVALIAGNLICTALGLLIQHRYTITALQQALRTAGIVASADEATVAVAALTPYLLSIHATNFVWTNGLLAVVVYLVVSRMRDEVSTRERESAAATLRGTTDLSRTQEAVIFGLAKLADSRDQATGDHLERISLYASTLAAALRRHDTYRDEVNASFVQHIGTSAALHDIGKVGIEDAILLKPGGLDAAEYRRMQEHTRIGADCLKDIERRLGSSNFLRMSGEIAAAHHERWDGTGYPLGLKGTAIPLSARIVAIADVYDALVSKRVYKKARAHGECVDIIRQEAGKHFDPQLVEVFLEIEPAFKNIAEQFSTALRPTAEPVREEFNRNLPTGVSEPTEAAVEQLI
jgi:HD-GYP domain-containing protein (c-di-GMP phosphodiesterase class II)